MLIAVDSSQLHFQIVILSKLTVKTGVYMKGGTIFILRLITARIHFHLYMLIIPWPIPKISNEVKTSFLESQDRRNIATTLAFRAVYLTLCLQPGGLRHPTNLSVEISSKV